MSPSRLRIQAIVGLLQQVSRQNLYAYVQTLQNFGTRHSLSAREREDFGIGAASRWIHDEFAACRRRSPPGRLPRVSLWISAGGSPISRMSLPCCRVRASTTA
jgi:hypothetical protein